MKKFLYFSAAALTTLFAASCSSEDPAAPVPAGEGVTFSIKLPADLQTRSFGDGYSAPDLHYVVYGTEGENLNKALPVCDGKVEGIAKFGEGQLETKVTLDLPHGVKYNIVFFAANDEAGVYTFKPELGCFVVNYAAQNNFGYNEANDCFIYTLKDFSIQGPTSTNVTLYRPVAQLNIGTSDYAQATAGALDASKTQVAVKNVYAQFNFLEGGEMTDKDGVKGIKGQALEASKTDVQFPVAAIPTGENFPYQPTVYKYMSMNYVLVGNEKDVVDVNFKLGDTRYNEVAFNNVPMQRNHRTNIFGALLTSPADFTVKINPIFDTPDYNYYDEATKDMLNDLAEGKAVTLNQDITLEKFPEMKDNNGTINLNGHTLTVKDYARIYGDVTIKNGEYVPGKDVAFDMKDGGKLTLDNVKGHANGSFVLVQPENVLWKGKVTIKNCELTGRDYCVSTNATNAATMQGAVMAGYSINISNSKLTGCETPVLVNVPIMVFVTDKSELIGSWQAMVVRGSNAYLDDSTFTTTCQAQANTTTQASGNQVPRAAITILNGDAYNYPAQLDVKNNCKINGNENVPAIYALKKGDFSLKVKVKNSTIVGETVDFGADTFDINK